MEIWFHPSKELTTLVKNCAEAAGMDTDFDPQIRPADPR